jgi:hypothetical protein
MTLYTYPDAGQLDTRQLVSELNAALNTNAFEGDRIGVLERQGVNYIEFEPRGFDNQFDKNVIQTTITNHIALFEKTDEEKAVDFRIQARDDISSQVYQLAVDGNSPRDAFIIAMFRNLATEYGGNPANVNSIQDGVNALNGLADYQEFTAGQRRFIRRLMSALINTTLTGDF